MKRKRLEEIKQEVGNILYQRWRDEGKHEFDRIDRDLTRREYEDMYVQWRYINFQKTEEIVRRNPGTCWDGE